MSKLNPQYFRRLRKKEGKTLKEWGERFRVAGNSVYRWESGDHPIPEFVVEILRLRRQIKTLEEQLAAIKEKMKRIL